MSVSREADPPAVANDKESLHGFEVNSTRIANPEMLDRLCVRIDSIMKSDTLQSITVRGTSSIDGPVPLNNRLAKERAQAVAAYIISHSRIPKNKVKAVSDGENWSDLLSLCREDSGLPMHDEVVAILESSRPVDAKENALRKLGDGSVWTYLAENIFPATRKSTITVEWVKAKAMVEVITDNVETPEPKEPEPLPTPEPEPQIPEPAVEIEEEIIEEIPVEIEEDTKNQADTVPQTVTPVADCKGDWHLSTSLPAWAVAVTNIAGEYDFACRWSVKLDLAYSAWNYGSHNRKFRTFVFRPEARYWFRDSHKGLFAEAHLAMIAYNVALPSWEYRIQDRKGKHPALGGGIGIGYRLPISRNGRWSAEAAVGAGVYSLDYNRYKNEPNGQLVDTKKRTFFGIDHVALSVVYNFGKNFSANKNTDANK